jgi:hypothetical protein
MEGLSATAGVLVQPPIGRFVLFVSERVTGLTP